MNRLTRETILALYKQAAASSSHFTWLNYQPINLPGYEETLALTGRNCFDRARAVLAHLRRVYGEKPLRIIDWGCNLGFFCFELARAGHDVVGVDGNPQFVGICRYLAETNDFPVRPQFHCDELHPDDVGRWSGFDVALCFSVLHHFKARTAAAIKAFAETYPVAFIELDGPGLGYDLLFPFYWDLTEVVRTSDPYCGRPHARKTWFCSNGGFPTRWENIKRNYLLGGRGIFLRTRGFACDSILTGVTGDRRSETRIDGGATVVKRELLRSRHSWIATNLEHEVAMYRAHADGGFFPRLIGAGTNDGFRWMEVEYVAADRSASLDELRRFFKLLEERRLFVLDVEGCSFLFRKGRLAVVDLESLFPVETTVADLVRSRTRKNAIELDEYEKQLRYVARRLLKHRGTEDTEKGGE